MILRQAQDERVFIDRLTAKARLLAETHLSTRRNDPARWRRASWLWPLFTRER